MYPKARMMERHTRVHSAMVPRDASTRYLAFLGFSLALAQFPAAILNLVRDEHQNGDELVT